MITDYSLAFNSITDDFRFRDEIRRLRAALKECRNELCVKCDNYHTAPNLCDTCKYNEDNLEILLNGKRI